MKTVSTPPPVHKRDPVRVRTTHTDARLTALELQMKLARFWISLFVTLAAIFGTLTTVALFYWYLRGGK